MMTSGNILTGRQVRKVHIMNSQHKVIHQKKVTEKIIQNHIEASTGGNIIVEPLPMVIVPFPSESESGLAQDYEEKATTLLSEAFASHLKKKYKHFKMIGIYYSIHSNFDAGFFSIITID